MSANYDVIVIGVGGMGSATVCELAQRGLRVLGIEQFPLGHDRGSSHGQTRIIRKAYFEHPSYVPLVRRAFEKWYDLELTSGRHLLTSCPCLNIGKPAGDIVSGVLASAREHHLPVDLLDAAALRREYPQFRFNPDVVAVRERDAGFLYVEDCVQAGIQVARAQGAWIHQVESVRDWQATGQSVTVNTDRGQYTAAALVITAGPWAASMLRTQNLPLTVMRQCLNWFRPEHAADYRRDRFPIFIADLPGGAFYGLPMLDHRGVKVAQHYGQPEQPDVSHLQREIQAADRVPVQQFLQDHLPGPFHYDSGQTCIYTLTPDRHFLIDSPIDQPNVHYAVGFSGHGYKFAPAIAEVLADRVINGQSRWDISRFARARFTQS